MKMTSINPEDYFGLNIKLMSLCGLRCSMTKTIGTFINKVPTFLANLVGIIYLVFEATFVIEAVRLRDVALISQILSQLVSNIQCITKGFLFAVSIEKMQSILHEIRFLWQRYQPDEEIQESILDNADRTLNFCKYYVTANFSCVLAYALPLVLNLFMQYQARESTNHTYDLSQMILLVKYPFEVTKVSRFIILVLLEEYLLVMNVIFWVSSDTLFAQTTTHICLQFKVLKQDIEKTFNYGGPNSKEILLKLVHRHRELLRICMLLEDVFSPIIFFTVFLSSVNMCVNVIGTRETISNQTYFNTGIYATILTMTIFQIFFFCIFAEKISEETTSLADMVYNLNWTAKDNQLGFYIYFIIVRAQRPFYCTAYGFFPIGHQRLTSIIRASFSYYMMLQTTDKK
ncbi:odorant receptor 272 isoform X1 [Nasonia vitripennis]|uniref:Odorant receptor n=1 Tax=Nasonia vitripennis TaxID=7425 RepID=A0A7M7ILK9_NASVI|nr:odorant receptor 272 [Nasonia vitripennis]XP_016836524.1 odorant receptor 272 isoform X1 [Nasonia vitripennis]